MGSDYLLLCSNGLNELKRKSRLGEDIYSVTKDQYPELHKGLLTNS